MADENTNAEPFHQVARKDVSRLLKSLKSHGSEALTVSTVLWTMAKWWTKNEKYRCSILAPEGGEDAGVCVMLLTEYEQVPRILLFSPEAESARFLSALKRTKLIPWDKLKVVARLTQRLGAPLTSCVTEIGRQIGPKADDPNYVMWMPPEEVLALKEQEPPANIRIRNLTMDDLSFVIETWKWSYCDSPHFIGDAIKHNGGLAAEDGDGKLIGSIVWVPFGGIGLLYVSSSHRRLGLGRLLTVRLAKLIAAEGLTVTAEVEHPNQASFKMFASIGFRYDSSNVYLVMNGATNESLRG